VKRAMIIIGTTWLVFIGFAILWAEVVQKPTRHPGDWWEVAVKTENLGGSERFYKLDGEYRVEVVGGGLKCLYKDGRKWTDNCGDGKAIILDALLGIGKEKYLSFPIAVGSRWKYSFTDSEGHVFSGEAVVAQPEKVGVAGKTFTAFRIERDGQYRGGHRGGPESVLYWYAPACKCIPIVKLKSGAHSWGEALMEIKLTNFEIRK